MCIFVTKGAFERARVNLRKGVFVSRASGEQIIFFFLFRDNAKKLFAWPILKGNGMGIFCIFTERDSEGNNW